MAFGAPYIVDGVEVPARRHRQHLFTTVKGETGVLRPDALKMQAVAGSPGVLGIGPGTGAISVESRGEAYQVYNDAMTGDALIGVDAAGSSAETWHGIVEINDPEQAGHDGTAANTPKLVSTLAGLTKPYLYLGSFTLEPGAGLDVTTPITDRRRIINARYARRMVTVFPAGSVAAETAHAAPPSAYSSWPLRSGERPTVSIPSWATHLQIAGHYSGIFYDHAGSAETVLGIRTGFGAEGAENGIIIAEPSNGDTRIHATVVGRHAVPEAVRGTDQVINLQAVRSSGTGTFYADYQSAIVIDYQFTEEPA